MGDLAVLDQERPVARHPRDRGLDRVHDVRVVEPGDEDARARSPRSSPRAPASPGSMNRLSGNGPSGFGGGSAWPVVRCAGLLGGPQVVHAVRGRRRARSGRRALARHALEVERDAEGSRRAGVVVDRDGVGAATCCALACPRSTSVPPSSDRPPKPIHARKPTSVETAERLEHDGVPAGRRGRAATCEATALSDARRPIAAGSSSSTRGREHLGEAAPAARRP